VFTLVVFHHLSYDNRQKESMNNANWGTIEVVKTSKSSGVLTDKTSQVYGLLIREVMATYEEIEFF